MKACSKCKELKPLSEFSKNVTRKDGYQHYCKACASELAWKYKRSVKGKVSGKKYKHSEKGKRANKKYKSSDKGMITNKKYEHSEKGREANRKKVRTYKEKFPNTVIAHNAARYLIRQPCESCGAEKTEAHHDDYNKPLDVRWLCRPCHRDWHKTNKASR